MLSSLAFVAEAAQRQDCTCHKQTDNTHLLGHICSTALCPITQSMNYIASALTSRPVTPKSIQSQSIRSSNSSMRGVCTPEEPSELEDSTRSTSLADSTLSPKRRSIAGSKSKTGYRFALPPPVGLHKQHFHLRPRVLLQLQRTSKTARPVPVLEVLPSVTFASRVARRLPRTLKGKIGLGADDLVIVNSEKYDTDDSESRKSDDVLEDARWDEREIVSVISNSNKDKTEGRAKAEIWLNSGETWTATILANGSYNFVFTDRHGLRTVARWVRKQANGSRMSTPQNRSRALSEEKRFNFSLLNPNSRRHAIIATLDRHSIEVSDQYTSPPMSPDMQVASTPTASLSEASADDYVQFRDVTLVSEHPTEVGEPLRNLIVVTGIWVALQEDMSTIINHSEAVDGRTVSLNPNTKYQRRSASLTINKFNSDQSPALANLSPGTPGSGETTSKSAFPLSLKTKSPPVRTPPRRIQSTGTAFMRRMTGRNNAANKIGQLSPVGDFDGSEAESSSIDIGLDSHEQSLKDDASSVILSSLRPRASSCESSQGSPLSPVISYGQDSPEDAQGSKRSSTRRPSRFGKMFGSKRRP